MVLNMLGRAHYARGIKNQDSVLELGKKNKRVRIVCDGCTNIDTKNPKTFELTHSEIGSGLFLQLYSLIENPFDSEKFIENANNIMKKMLSIIDYDGCENLTQEKLNFINYNFCFTIVACFEEEDKFVTYILGDGVIIVENKFGVLSFIEKKFGECPPYLVYNYITEDQTFDFEKTEFDKSYVNDIGVATDGLMPALSKIVTDKAAKLNFDKAFKNKFLLKNLIESSPNIFGDDVAIAISLGEE